LLAALGWRVLLPRGRRPSLGFLFRLRLIKEAVNALLPVAQVGGDVVRARLAARDGLTSAEAAASCFVDVLIATISLAAFVLAGLLTALAVERSPGLLHMTLALLAVALSALGAVALGRRWGAAKGLGRLTARWRATTARLADLGAAIRRLGRQRADLAASVGWHLASWGFGVVETYAAMWAIGLHAGFLQAFILESLAQAVKGVGFAIPGALGVQEGGYILLGGVLGVSPDQALALSLLRRVRELSLGALGLAAWRLTKSPAAASHASWTDPSPGDPA
jgi:putative membrane protein